MRPSVYNPFIKFILNRSDGELSEFSDSAGGVPDPYAHLQSVQQSFQTQAYDRDFSPVEFEAKRNTRGVAIGSGPRLIPGTRRWRRHARRELGQGADRDDVLYSASEEDYVIFQHEWRHHFQKAGYSHFDSERNDGVGAEDELAMPVGVTRKQFIPIARDAFAAAELKHSMHYTGESKEQEAGFSVPVAPGGATSGGELDEKQTMEQEGGRSSEFPPTLFPVYTCKYYGYWRLHLQRCDPRELQQRTRLDGRRDRRLRPYCVRYVPTCGNSVLELAMNALVKAYWFYDVRMKDNTVQPSTAPPTTADEKNESTVDRVLSETAMQRRSMSLRRRRHALKDQLTRRLYHCMSKELRDMLRGVKDLSFLSTLERLLVRVKQGKYDAEELQQLEKVSDSLILDFQDLRSGRLRVFATGHHSLDDSDVERNPEQTSVDTEKVKGLSPRSIGVELGCYFADPFSRKLVHALCEFHQLQCRSYSLCASDHESDEPEKRAALLKRGYVSVMGKRLTPNARSTDSLDPDHHRTGKRAARTLSRRQRRQVARRRKDDVRLTVISFPLHTLSADSFGPTIRARVRKYVQNHYRLRPAEGKTLSETLLDIAKSSKKSSSSSSASSKAKKQWRELRDSGVFAPRRCMPYVQRSCEINQSDGVEQDDNSAEWSAYRRFMQSIRSNELSSYLGGLSAQNDGKWSRYEKALMWYQQAHGVMGRVQDPHGLQEDGQDGEERTWFPSIDAFPSCKVRMFVVLPQGGSQAQSFVLSSNPYHVTPCPFYHDRMLSQVMFDSMSRDQKEANTMFCFCKPDYAESVLTNQQEGHNKEVFVVEKDLFAVELSSDLDKDANDAGNPSSFGPPGGALIA